MKIGRNNYFFSIIFALALSLLITNTEINAETWTKVNGVKPYINKIYFPTGNNSLIAIASENGDFEKPLDLMDQNLLFPDFGEGFQLSTDKGETFSEEKLILFSVYEFIQRIDEPSKWYASVRSQGRGGIAVSTDNGNSWNTDFLLCDASYQFMSIIPDKTDANKYYGAAVRSNNGFKYTEDAFSNCVTNENLNIQARSIALSPFNEDLLFIAGDNFYDGGVYRSYNKGQSWLKNEIGLENLRIHCVIPSAADPSIILCGADSVTSSKEVRGKGIYRSIDTGKTWDRVGAWGASVFAIAQHPSNPNYLVAACGYDGVWFSGNGGRTWEPNNSGLPQDISIRNVAFPNWDVTDEGVIAFAGSFGDGLYKSKRVVANVEENIHYCSNLSVTYLYPNPANNYIFVEFENPNNQYLNIQIKDILGSTVYERNHTYYFTGKQSIRIDLPSNISEGIYYISVFNGSFNATSKFAIVK